MAEYTLPQANKVEGLHPTAIEWTDYSANPLRAVTREGKAGWACQKVATGCMHCYAEAVNIRFGTGLPFSASGMKDVRVVLDERRVAAMLNAKPRGPFRSPDGRPKVFVCDMTDLFGEWVPFETIDRLFALFALRQDIDWQILTKRPERMAEYLNDDPRGRWRRIEAQAVGLVCDHDLNVTKPAWPLPNVWAGCSAATQADLDRNVPHLLRCPAAVRFLSLEPLVEVVDLRFGQSEGVPTDAEPFRERADLLQWVITGGESGPKARPCNIEWILGVVEQCAEAVVPCFVKQLGSWSGTDRAIDIKFTTKDSKGGDPDEWPEDLRVRQWPHREDTTDA